MSSHSALTEEGRTRIRNFSGRLNSYLILWILIGVLVVIGCIWIRTRFGYLPLQRLYLSQYMKASLKSLTYGKRLSQYTLLIRVVDANGQQSRQVIPCTDKEVSPVRDASGHVLFDPKLGPFFRLREGIPHTFFYWARVARNDAQMYVWLRDQIYQGHSIIGLYWFCFLPLPIVAIVGMVLSVKIDVRINREYEEGRLVRGVRLLNESEYLKEARQNDGLGLPVLRSLT